MYFNRFFGISRHGPNSHSFPSPFMSAFHLFQCPPTKEKFWKSSFKAHKQSNNKTHSSPPSFPPVHLFVLVSLVATVCHAVYSFFQTTCIANCIVMSWIFWFKASDFLYTIQYLTLIKSPLLCPVVVLSHGDSVAMFLQEWSLYMLQQVIDEIDVGACQLKALDVGLGGSSCSVRASTGTASSDERWNQLSCALSEGWDQLSHEGQGQTTQGHGREGLALHDPQISTYMIHMAPIGNIGCGYQHRPQL